MKPAIEKYTNNKYDKWLAGFYVPKHCCLFDDWNDFDNEIKVGTFVITPMGTFCITNIIKKDDCATNSKAAPTIYCEFYSFETNTMITSYLSLYDFIYLSKLYKYSIIHTSENITHYALGSIIEILN